MEKEVIILRIFLAPVRVIIMEFFPSSVIFFSVHFSIVKMILNANFGFFLLIHGKRFLGHQCFRNILMAA